MKNIFIFLFSLILFSGCSPKVTQNGQEATIIYQAFSRGYFLSVELQGNKLTVSKERDVEGKDLILNDAEAKELSALFQKITLADLETYKGPTEKRFYDGAAIANLTANQQGKVYKTPDFDHGNPPVEIAEFINKIVAFTEK